MVFGIAPVAARQGAWAARGTRRITAEKRCSALDWELDSSPLPQGAPVNTSQDHTSSDALPGESLGRVLDFLRLLWAVDHGLTSVSKQMQRSLGVTGLQRLTVRLVGRYPGIGAGALARMLHVHPGTLTGVLQRLEQRGALERVPDPSDGRRTLLRLTKKGTQLDLLRAGTVEARVKRALDRVDEEDVDATRRVLSVIAEALNGPV